LNIPVNYRQGHNIVFGGGAIAMVMASIVGVWVLCPSGYQGQSPWSGCWGKTPWSWKQFKN